MKLFKKFIVIVLVAMLITPVMTKPVRTMATDIYNEVSISVDFDSIALNPDSTEGAVKERVPYAVSPQTFGLSVDKTNSTLMYRTSSGFFRGVGEGFEFVESSKDYYIEIVLNIYVTEYDWPSSIKTIELAEHPNISEYPDLSIRVNGSKRNDVYLAYNKYYNYLGLLIPISINYITPINISGATAAPPDGVEYSGHSHEPKLSIKLNGETLIENLHYNLYYYENTDPGQASVFALGVGKYTGSLTRHFYIYFLDVPPTHSYKNAVYWAASFKIATGYTGNKKGYFGISDNVTRGQVAMMLWRAKGKPEPVGTKQKFKDVPVSHSFYKAIQWAYEQGITGGYTGSKAGYFGVNDNCTRGQIVTFLWRFEGKPEPIGHTQKFKDVPVTHNFYKAIQWAYEQEITSGYSNGTFGVNKFCTRGHCVTFMYKDMVKG